MTEEKAQHNAGGQNNDKAAAEKEKRICGIIRPISAMPPDYSDEQHWKDVAAILDEAIKAAGFEPLLVSAAAEISVIQKTIIQNLYNCEIVVCDVSGKNANVMFELGMRLAFDKATVIIKDNKTAYSFDTSPIEHLTYPKSLHYSKIVDFKEELRGKLQSTHKAARKDKNYSPFLKSFGQIVPAKLHNQEVPEAQYQREKLEELSEQVGLLIALQRRQNEERQQKEQIRFVRSRKWGEQQRLRQELQRTREELPHVSSARQAAMVTDRIAALEARLKELGDDDMVPFRNFT